MSVDPRREALRGALDGLWVTEAGTGFAVALDDVLARLDRAGLTTPKPSPPPDVSWVTMTDGTR